MGTKVGTSASAKSAQFQWNPEDMNAIVGNFEEFNAGEPFGSIPAQEITPAQPRNSSHSGNNRNKHILLSKT